jgi:hypothetical protein
MKKIVYCTAVLLLALLGFAGCVMPTEPDPKPEPELGILTINNFPEGYVAVYNHGEDIATEAALQAAMADPALATASGRGSPLELKSAGNQAFNRSGTFLVGCNGKWRNTV